MVEGVEVSWRGEVGATGEITGPLVGGEEEVPKGTDGGGDVSGKDRGERDTG